MTYHQGDIILEPIDNIPQKAKFVRKNIVNYGEITGHAHVIEDAEIYELNGVYYVRVVEDKPMTHNDHPDTQVIKKHDYRRRVQMEYFPDGSRQVKD